MIRGEIWWVDLNPTKGSEINKKRPAVILSVNPINKARRTVIVIPLSSSPFPRPPIVVPTPSAGANSVAVCDQIRAVDKKRLVQRMGQLSQNDLTQIIEALKIIIGI
jgi:mRNA interferase MazF